MTTKIDTLYPTRSEAHRGLRWTPCPAGCPCAGVLEIVSGRAATRNAVTEFQTAGGRAIRLTKDAAPGLPGAVLFRGGWGRGDPVGRGYGRPSITGPSGMPSIWP